ncbi:MAG: hypothetical protein M3155_04740 [Actinomycetota bacterium]|nr:hypothetical protein [Actinomycetota bacterium]
MDLFGFVGHASVVDLGLAGVLGLLLGPLIVLVHELGHALAALRHTHGTVRVYVGRDPGPTPWRAGRLEVYIGLRLPRGGPSGLCLHLVPHRALDQVWISLAGPAATAATAVAFFLAMLATSSAAAFLPLAFFGAAFGTTIMLLFCLGDGGGLEGNRETLFLRDGEVARAAWRAHRRRPGSSREPERSGSIPPPRKR